MNKLELIGALLLTASSIIALVVKTDKDLKKYNSSKK